MPAGTDGAALEIVRAAEACYARSTKVRHSQELPILAPDLA